MKTAWRELLSKAAVGCVGIGALANTSGCQSWSPNSWGVPTSTRVPPPPTYTVKPQGAYYNNPPMGTPASPVKSTTQVTPNSSAPVVQASAVSPFGSNGSLPATNLSENSSAFSTNVRSISSQATGSQGTNNSSALGGQVSTADYQDNGSGMAQVVTAGSLQGAAIYNSDSGMGTSSNAGEGANLQWTAK